MPEQRAKLQTDEESPEETVGSPDGRVNQKARTRAAILSAAIELTKRGKAPSVSDAAKKARVGRTTAYRYFPTQDHLLYEAIFDKVPVDLDRSLRAARPSAEPEARLLAVLETINGRVQKVEQAFRANLQRSLEAIAADPTIDPRRTRLFGGSRMLWLSEALEPIRDELGPEKWQRLISALSLCLGVEPYIVLRDACGLDAAEANEVIHWVSTSTLRQALGEADEQST